jgi:hypothetical protein
VPRRALLAAALLAVLPSAASADTRLVSDPRATDVAAFRGIVLYVREEPSRDRLARVIGGRARIERARPALDIDDLDLGTSRSGALVAVYSRCSDFDDPNTCDLFAYDVRRRRESMLRGTSRRGCAEYAPSIDRGVLVFVRARFRGRSRRCREGLYRKRPGRRARRFSRRLATDTDLFGRRLIASLARRGDPTVELLDSRGRGRLLARYRGAGRDDDLVDPTISGRYAYWVEEDLPEDAAGTARHTMRRRPLTRRGRTRSLALRTRDYTGFAVAGRRFLYSLTSMTPEGGGIFSFRPRFGSR